MTLVQLSPNRQSIIFHQYADNALYCPHCQIASFHYVIHLHIISKPTYDGHIWSFKCINPECGHTFVKIQTYRAEKEAFYAPRRTPVYGMTPEGTYEPFTEGGVDDVRGMFDSPKLLPKIVGQTGWLSPGGIYYPCIVPNPYKLDAQIWYNHEGYAYALCYQLLGYDEPELVNLEQGEVQKMLMDQGWLRVDVMSVLSAENITPTPSQIKTLNRLWMLPEQRDDSIGRDAIREFLKNHSVTK